MGQKYILGDQNKNKQDNNYPKIKRNYQDSEDCPVKVNITQPTSQLTFTTCPRKAISLPHIWRF